MTGPAISYDKVRQLPWEANTSNDSVIVFITVCASTLESMGGYKCLVSLKKVLSMVLDILVCRKEPAGPIVDIVAA